MKPILPFISGLMRIPILLLAVSMPFTLCAQPGVAKEQRILYVGNSLTYFNNLPSLIREIAAQDGVNISDSSFLYPDYSLEDHWNEGKVASAIASGKFDFVVAQQGPSAMPESQIMLKNSVAKFVVPCRDANSRLALFMVWPSQARSFDLDNVIHSYTRAAEANNALLCPAGMAWKYAWQSDPDLPLYSNDRFHPGIYGSVLSALTIYGSLYGKKDFRFLEYKRCSWKDTIPRDKFRLLVNAALKAIGN